MTNIIPAFIPTLVTIDVGSFCYEPSEAHDETRQKYGAALANTSVNKCIDELKEEVRAVYNALSLYDALEIGKMCPSIAAFIASNGGEIHENLLEVRNCTWVCDTMTQNEDESCDDEEESPAVVGYSVHGRVHIELDRPSSIDAATFRKEFTAMIYDWSNHIVEWGWMDCGYMLNADPDECINKLT